MRDLVHELLAAPLMRFSRWDRTTVPSTPGVYAVFDVRTSPPGFVYAGMAGRSSKQKGGRLQRLVQHTQGRRSGDQFCVYVCDRLVLPTLSAEQIKLISTGELFLDDLTREFIHARFAFRYVSVASSAAALDLETYICQDGLPEFGTPLLNPFSRRRGRRLEPTPGIASPRQWGSHGERVLSDEHRAGSLEEAEWFEYPIAWETAYRAKRGSRRYFAQYALMELLRQSHGIESLTWLHLASVDRDAKERVKAGEPWVPASPSQSSKNPRRRQMIWNTMRARMGTSFERLQEAIVREKFVGAYQGEPDLFCWTSRGWFFAEAKTLDESILPSQRRWWSVATNLAGIDCPVFVCRMVAQGSQPTGQTAHTIRWNQLVERINARNSGALGAASDFVKRVLSRRNRA